MKYKIRAYNHSENDWESQYIEPASLVGDIVMTGNPVRLSRHFKTEEDANDYTVQHLKEKNINDYGIIYNK